MLVYPIPRGIVLYLNGIVFCFRIILLLNVDVVCPFTDIRQYVSPPPPCPPSLDSGGAKIYCLILRQAVIDCSYE